MKTFLFLGLALFFIYEVAQCHEKSIKNYLSSYKNIHVSNFSPALSNISFLIHIKYISLEAYGKEFEIVLELYLPLHNRYECQRSLNETDDFEYVLGNELALYRGKVKNVSDSLVLGFFMDSGNFKGYIITDKVYCIEYDRESGIAYRFQDVMLPGCKHAKKGKEVDCSKFFDIQSNKEWDHEQVNVWKNSKNTHPKHFTQIDFIEDAQKDMDKGKVIEDNTSDILHPTIVARVNNIDTQIAYNKDKESISPKGESNVITSETFDDFLGDLFKDHANGKVKSLKDHEEWDPEQVNVWKNSKNTRPKHFTQVDSVEDAQKDMDKEKVIEDNTSHILHPTIVARVNNIETQISNNKDEESVSPKGESNVITSETFDDFLGDLFKDHANGKVKSLKDDEKTKLEEQETVLGEVKHESLWQTVLDKEIELLKLLENLDAELFNKSHLSRKNVIENAIHYKSCSIEIIVNSPTVQKQGHSNDLIRDIYLQTEMLNILFKKLSFRSKSKECQINFHIEKIIRPKKDFFTNSSSSFKSFVGKHALNNHSCLVLGLDMASSSSNYIISHIKTKRSNSTCSQSIDPVVLKYGTTEDPMPMVLFLVAYVTAITKVFGATIKDETHHLSSVKDIEKYFLTKNVPLENSEGSFSQYNFEEIERCLPKKRSLRQLNHTKCGNAVEEEGEECDCGPELLCNDIDKCCVPTTNRSDVPGCVLRPHAQCSSKSPCCKNCTFSKKGTKCVTSNDECPVGECDGERSVCHCNMVASWNRSPCQGLECGAIICARVGLKPCICRGKDACLICCEKNRVCQTATFDLKVAGNTLFFFPDGSSCDYNKVCYNGTCGDKNRKYPFMWKTIKVPGSSSGHLKRSQSASSRCVRSLMVACLLFLYCYINYNSVFKSSFKKLQ